MLQNKYFLSSYVEGVFSFLGAGEEGEGKKSIALFVSLSLKVGSIIWRVKSSSISVDFPWLLLSG